MRPTSQISALAGVIEQNNATGTVSYWRGGGHQSEADRNGVSLADYVHALYGLLRQKRVHRVAIIGCGGGTLATMLHYAGAAPVVVDIDPAAFVIAHDYFQMPAAIERRQSDGATFLKRTRQRFDAIVLDAYMGQHIPAHLLTDAFFTSAKARLRPRGLLLLNLIVADDADPLPHDIGTRLRSVFRHVRLLDRPGWINRNAILVAGDVARLHRPRLLMTPQRRARSLAAALKTFAFRPVLDRAP
ncbi:MAG: fused MFS/spermidine synthase [Alphaproteobacteria bacterium]|nr:fused MFS/spermidine synthase [Alphaproteobacteria bacterium]